MWPPTLFRVKVLLRREGQTRKKKKNFFFTPPKNLLISNVLLFFISITIASPITPKSSGAKLLIEEFLTDFVPITTRPPILTSSSSGKDLKDDDTFSQLFSKTYKSSLSSKPSHGHFQHRFLPFRVKIFNESEESPLPLPDDNLLSDETYSHYKNDPLLNFDSPLQTETFLDCTVRYQNFWPFISSPPKEPYEDELKSSRRFVDLPTPVQVQITGPRCDLVGLVLLQLKHKRNITHLVLKDTGVRSLDRRLFADARLTSLRRVDILQNSQLTYIDRGTFDELTSLQILRLFNCHSLKHFHRQALLGTKALRSFLWAENGPQQLRSELFINLTKATAKHFVPVLEQLIIVSSTSLTPKEDQLHPKNSPDDLKLAKDDLAQLSQIKSLQLAGVHLSFIHPLTFTFLAANLQSLHLVDNLQKNSSSSHFPLDNLIALFSTLAKLGPKRVKLTLVNLSGSVSAINGTLPKQFLLPLSKLPVKTLILKRNSLTSIAVDDLPSMPNLEKLILDENPLIFIADHAFDRLENLSHLSLASSQLTSIRSELFYNLPKLSYLDLSGSPSRPSPLNIALRTFVGLNLKILHLSYRILDPLPNKAFLGLHKTEELYLRGCGLTSIEYLTFFFLKSLRLLDLSENTFLIESLRTTHDDSFFGLESIESVKMAKCNLVSDDLLLIFTRMHEHVQELDLSGNLLEHLSAEHFAQFGELRSLNLSNNQIRPWTNGSIFSGNKDLTVLDLTNNHLDHISSSMMEDLFRMSNLSFGSNPIVCDCSSEFIVGGWLNSTLIKPILFMDSQNPLTSSEQYYCVLDEDDSLDKINLQDYNQSCARKLLTNRIASNFLMNSYLVLILTLSAFLISFAVLAVAFAYYSELNQIFANSTFWRKNSSLQKDDLNGKYEYDAFVSYNVSDSEWIFSELVPNIENNSATGSCQRVRLCVYDRDFIAGRPISECILESIRLSRRVILVISNAFIQSPWCRFETDLAAHHSTLNVNSRTDGLILVKLEQLDEGLSLPLLLDFLLKTRIYLEWDSAAGEEQRQKFWRKLKIALGVEKAQVESQKLSKLQRIRAKISQIFEDFFSDWILETEVEGRKKSRVDFEEEEIQEVDEEAVQKEMFKKRQKKLKKDVVEEEVESREQVHCTRYFSKCEAL